VDVCPFPEPFGEVFAIAQQIGESAIAPWKGPREPKVDPGKCRISVPGISHGASRLESAISSGQGASSPRPRTFPLSALTRQMRVQGVPLVVQCSSHRPSELPSRTCLLITRGKHCPALSDAMRSRNPHQPVACPCRSALIPTRTALMSGLSSTNHGGFPLLSGQQIDGHFRSPIRQYTCRFRLLSLSTLARIPYTPQRTPRRLANLKGV
jgi:hypothetical protein